MGVEARDEGLLRPSLPSAAQASIPPWRSVLLGVKRSAHRLPPPRLSLAGNDARTSVFCQKWNARAGPAGGTGQGWRPLFPGQDQVIRGQPR